MKQEFELEVLTQLEAEKNYPTAFEQYQQEIQEEEYLDSMLDSLLSDYGWWYL